MAELGSRASQQKEAARRTANNHFLAWEQRTALVKKEVAAERAASDAKTAKLRALRLAKEEADREATRLAAENAPATPPKKRTRRTG